MGSHLQCKARLSIKVEIVSTHLVLVGTFTGLDSILQAEPAGCLSKHEKLNIELKKSSNELKCSSVQNKDKKELLYNLLSLLAHDLIVA